MTELRLHGLSYEDRLRGADLTVRPGETVGLIGPNGSGKTTLLRCVYGTLVPTSGRALLDGDDLHALGPKARARRVATVPQDSATEFELTVRELVALGRSPHKRFWEGDTGADRGRAGAALARVGLAELADRPYPTLSGGERQRALVARALVQDPDLLVLDEPTNHLDIRHQLDVLALVRELGTTNLLALHDLNLAGAYCDRLYVLERGRVVTGGTPDEVLTPALLEAVYGVDAEVIPHPRTGRPTVLYQHRPAGGQESSTM
ncbi:MULTISPECIES: ABC transporter ATP-binding protein [unclassified Streptomyces]|uniref:ABC transporter ATP-binding protein n=1 Tax=unclassified Streptomyces TaxID=2593676 RepID=UPI0006F3E6F0|nr:MULTISPECIES: ABC transporter ATP-binding protein [unclassified Streptomyces]KQX52732.1 histidinol phosphatase [Streptomyces sp. Root1304]KRA89647.1 histidinol phosphatase [Streptomyces sp. Root66D1]